MEGAQTLVFNRALENLTKRISKKQVDIDIAPKNLAYILLRNKTPKLYKTGADMAFLGYGFLDIVDFFTTIMITQTEIEGLDIDPLVSTAAELYPRCMAFYRPSQVPNSRDFFFRKNLENEMYYIGDFRALNQLNIESEPVEKVCRNRKKCIPGNSINKLDIVSYTNALMKMATWNNKYDYRELEKIACSLVGDVKINININPDALLKR